VLFPPQPTPVEAGAAGSNKLHISTALLSVGGSSTHLRIQALGTVSPAHYQSGSLPSIACGLNTSRWWAAHNLLLLRLPTQLNPSHWQPRNRCRNFAFGGDWVIQRALSNSEQLSSMLPPGAPLSTLRVVTASTAWLAQQAAHGGSECTKLQQYPAVHGTHDRCSEPRTADDKSRPRSTTEQHGPAPFNSVQPASAAAGRFTPDLPVSAGILQQDEAGRHSSNRAQPWSSSNNGTASTGTAAGGKNSSMPGPASAACSNGNSAAGMYDGQVRVVTAVWRAGLAGKDTDHSSICFPMDPATGLLAAGVSANHWYRLGLKWAGRPDASTAGRTWLQHPDSSVTVAGRGLLWPWCSRCTATVHC